MPDYLALTNRIAPTVSASVTPPLIYEATNKLYSFSP